jgi:hypothetical protein
MTFPYIRPYNIHNSSSFIPPVEEYDNTPDSINWGAITWNTGGGPGTIDSKQITGISSGILLEIQPGSGSCPDLYYRISSSQITGTQTNDPPSAPWSIVSSGTTVIVSGDQWLSFTCHGSFGLCNRTATVINKSDEDAVLDTFTYALQDV